MQNDASKNSLWRPTSSLGTNSSNNTDKKGKGAAFTPSLKKPSSSNGGFSDNGSKGFSNSKKWSKSRDGASNSKGFAKSSGHDKGSSGKRKVSFTEKPFES
jgi:hypothetical protein